MRSRVRWLPKVLLGLVVLIGAGLLGIALGTTVGIYRGGSPHQGRLALVGGRLIDGTGKAPIENAVVVIRDDRVEQVGHALTVPPDAEVIDVGGLTLLPGLIDCHVHVSGPMLERGGRRTLWTLLPDFWDYGRRMARRRRLAIEHGVTTIKSVGDMHPSILELRDDIATGRLEGPRIFTVGAGFTAPGGHPAGTIFKGNQWLIERGTRQMVDPQEARREVARLATDGVDGIKVINSSGSGRLPKLSRSVLHAVIDEAHARGLRVVAHTNSAEEIREAVEAGIDGLEHGLTDPEDPPADLVELMRERGIYYVPTLSVSEQNRPDVLPRLQKHLKRFASAGVKIALGTDAGNPGVKMGAAVHRELELMVAAGLAPIEALQAATRNAAEHLGTIKDLGTVQSGKLADVIAVGGDPLKNISDTRNVRLVVKGGKVLLKAGVQ